MATATKNPFIKGLGDISGRDGYYRNNVTIGRWAYGWDIFKTNFTKLVGLNLIMLLFIAPIVVFIYFRYAQIYTLAHQAPFTANIGVGYAPATNLLGSAEAIVLTADWEFFRLLPLMGAWLAVGLSGGLFVMRNLAWGEDVSVIKGFFTGVRRHYLTVLFVTALFTVFLSAAMIGISYLDFAGAVMGGKVWYQVVLKILLIIAICFAALWYLEMLPLSVSYNASPLTILKNSLLFTVKLLVPNIFFAIVSLVPGVLFLLGNTLLAIALMVVMFIGISLFMLVNTVYHQWVYDKFVNKYIKEKYKLTEADLKRINKKKASSGDDEYDTAGEAPRGFEGAIKPITDDEEVAALPKYFGLGDIENMMRSKIKMLEDAKEYASDPKKYAETHVAASAE